MAYVPKIFKDRSVEFPGRRVLTPVSGMANTSDVTRAEGTVFEAGTLIDATNLNAEFDKIKTETDAINNSLSGVVLLKEPLGAVNTLHTLSSNISNFKRIQAMIQSTDNTNSYTPLTEIFVEDIVLNTSTLYFHITSGSSLYTETVRITTDAQVKTVTNNFGSSSGLTLKIVGYKY